MTPQPVRLNIPQSRKNMGLDSQYDVVLSDSAKAKAVGRPLAERLRKDGLEHLRFPLQSLAFSLQPFPTAPIKGSLAQFLYINGMLGFNECAAPKMN